MPGSEEWGAEKSLDALFMARTMEGVAWPGITWDRCDTIAKTNKRYDAAAKREAFGRSAEAAEAFDRLESDVARGHASIVSVLAFGAVGNASIKHDDGPALAAAVEAGSRLAAEASSSSRVVVLVPGPANRTYLVRRVTLRPRGIELRIEGTILVPSMAHFLARPMPEIDARASPELRRMQFACFEISDARNVVVTGGGGLDGRGQAWWVARKADPTVRAPVLMLIRDSINVSVTHLRLQKAPFYHLVVLRSRRVGLARLGITSPWFSVNTDGIDVLESHYVYVRDCWISTGDDNVAVKEGTTHLVVRGGTFHHGHGLSIGSLGENGTTSAPVEHVHLVDVTFVRTHHAARVKTWQGGRGRVSNVSFHNLTCAAVALPIVIDQFYCPQTQHPEPCANSTAAVTIEDVAVTSLRGWHTTGLAAMLHCSDAQPCRVDLSDIDLQPAPGCWNYSRCWNVEATKLPFRDNHHVLCARGNEMHGYRFDVHDQTSKPKYCYLSSHYGHKRFCTPAAAAAAAAATNPPDAEPSKAKASGGGLDAPAASPTDQLRRWTSPATWSVGATMLRLPECRVEVFYPTNELVGPEEGRYMGVETARGIAELVGLDRVGLDLVATVAS
ncbi:hypothetical protein CTAYLR_006295 [Chrysophaeum taylorii]|uniref:Polygalacturonase n=1 Tax=Chrysophaeum taylorii TaxID=2483200 RepID=A0AAD7UL37_9STRA|nr:hypothetical protein CTAYLR_006295 [Chrysophaeum taylorii]